MWNHGRRAGGRGRSARSALIAAGLAALLAIAVTDARAAERDSGRSGSGAAFDAPAACEAGSPETLMDALSGAGGLVMAGEMAPPPATISAVCALPYQRGKPGSDCTGWHDIVFSTAGTTTNAVVTAELLGLDLQGNVIQALRVENGDSAHLSSRVDPSEFKMTSKNGTHQVFAPIPMLRITVEDQGQKTQAFCSNIPYLQVIEPRGQVIAESDGNVTNVLAAVPLVNPSTLDVVVDGTSILDPAHLNIPDLSACSASTPCGGVVTINSASVTVSNLVLEASGGVGNLSSNTLRMTLEGLACGGHVYVLDGEQLPGVLRSTATSQCHDDDVLDLGSSSVFAIDITSPLAGEVTTAVPTPVQGQVCAGREIVNVQLNGVNANISGQSCTPGDGVTTGTTCVVPIDATLGETNLAQDISTGDAPLGTFDAGSNRLVASATDDIGTRTYEKVVFATGNVAAPGVETALLQSALEQAVQDELTKALLPQVQMAMTATSTEIDNAFVVGISAAGAQKLFDQLCTAPNPNPESPNFGKTPGQIFKDTVEAAILALPQINTSIDPPCSCEAPVTVKVDSVNVGNAVTCPIVFSDDKFRVSVKLPDVTVHGSATGQCEDEVLDVCVARTVVNVQSTATISNISLDFDVTEGNLLNNTTSPSIFVHSTPAISVSGGVDLQCIGADICEVVLTVVTLGIIDFSPSIDISAVTDITKQVGAAEPDPVRLKEIKVDEEVVANFDQKLSGLVSDVQITPAGISAGLKGTFATLAVDPEVESTPGAVLTPAPLPILPVPNAQDVFIGLADDTMNQMFASMTMAGKLKNACTDTGKTIGDLLPANCEDINLILPAATAIARGACYGVKGADCESIAMSALVNDLNTATEQGVCHAYKAADCNAIPLAAGPLAALTERNTCANTRNPNLHADQHLLFCARQDIPPRLLLEDNTSTSTVESALRLNDLTVAMLVDRGDPGLTGALAETPSCFATGASTAGDCNLLGVCMDLNFNFNMQFETCADGKPGFRNQFTSIQILNREPGVVCGGSSTAAQDGDVLDQAATDETVTIDLTARAEDFAPPVCGAGLSMGGFVTCKTPTLFTMNTDGSPTFKDYIGITCLVEK